MVGNVCACPSGSCCGACLSELRQRTVGWGDLELVALALQCGARGCGPKSPHQGVEEEHPPAARSCQRHLCRVLLHRSAGRRACMALKHRADWQRVPPSGQGVFAKSRQRAPEHFCFNRATFPFFSVHTGHSLCQRALLSCSRLPRDSLEQVEAFQNSASNAQLSLSSGLATAERSWLLVTVHVGCRQPSSGLGLSCELSFP